MDYVKIYILPLLPTLVRDVIMAVYSFHKLLAASIAATENYGGGIGAGIGGAIGAFLGSFVGPQVYSGLGGVFGGMIGGAVGGFKQHHSHLFSFLGGLGGAMCACVGALAADTVAKDKYKRTNSLTEGIAVATGGLLGGAFGGFFGPQIGIVCVYKMWPLAAGTYPGLYNKSWVPFYSPIFFSVFPIFVALLHQLVFFESYKTPEDIFTRLNATMSSIEKVQQYLELTK